jgi:hypothetical protein
MLSRKGTPGWRQRGRVRRLRPALLQLEPRVVPALPGITGITFDASGDVFVSYDSSNFFSGQQQTVEEFSFGGTRLNSSLISTSGPSAVPGNLATVDASESLPTLATGDILELQPDGELFDANPANGLSAAFGNSLASLTPDASHVYDVQTGEFANLDATINLASATFGDFGVSGSSLIVSGVANNWDFVMRVTYGAQPTAATASILAASPASASLTASPGGVAVDSQGTVLATLPDIPAGSTTAIDVPVGFNLFYDQNNAALQPFLPSLGLSAPADLESTGITVDADNNFILAMSNSSLYGGGPGVAHINASLTAFLADPPTPPEGTPYAVAYVSTGGSNYLGITEPQEETFALPHELPLFSGQVTPGQVLTAYGINQIRFAGPGGTTVPGDGTGQTIAIVELGADPTIQADLHTFDQFYNIPDPPSFSVIYQNNVTTPDPGSVGEASLDVEWAHAIAPKASIVVVDAAFDPNNLKTSFLNLFPAMQLAASQLGVSVVSLSYGGGESLLTPAQEQQFDSDFTAKGVTFVASSGDFGIYGDGSGLQEVLYPTASPNVVSVGGTSITIDAAGDYPGTGLAGEVGWGSGTNARNTVGSGGGLSTVEPEPSWQMGVVPASLDPNSFRAVPDVAMDSGSMQPYDVFTSTLAASTESMSAVGWLGDAGTSASAPIWAALIAIADQGRALQGGTPLTGSTQTLPALYSLPASDFHDIVNGYNGYNAGPGYDLVTGRGSPIANLLVPVLADYQLSSNAASQIAITTEPPPNIAAGSSFSLTLQLQNSQGELATGASGTVTVALGNNPGNATLGGTLTVPVSGGTATFSGLTISQPGSNYTLVITASALPGAEATSNPINVSPVSSPTQIVVTASNNAPVYGQSVTLTATVTATNPASGVPTGTVTFEIGTTILGPVPLSDGVATLVTTPASVGTETIVAGYSGDATDAASNVTFHLTVAQAPATLTLSNLTATYDGLPHTATATTTPADLPGVMVTYTQNGAAVTSPTAAGSYTVMAVLDNPNYTAQSVTGTLVINPAPATLTLGNLTATYDGSPHTASVTTSPPGLSGVTVTYTQNGVAVASPTAAGSYAVTAVLDNPNASAPAATGTLVIGRASPVVNWTISGDLVAGTPLGAAQLDATAKFNGVPLGGTFNYNPGAGTVLPTGNGQTLTVTFTPADSTDFASATASVSINVAPQSTQPASPVTIQGAHWQTRKLSRKVTQHVIVIGFSGPLEPAPAENLGNYELVALEKARKPGALVTRRVSLASASYTPRLDTVMLVPRGTVPNQALQLTILTAGILDAEGNPLSGGAAGRYVTTLGRNGV